MKLLRRRCVCQLGEWGGNDQDVLHTKNNDNGSVKEKKERKSSQIWKLGKSGDWKGGLVSKALISQAGTEFHP